MDHHKGAQKQPVNCHQLINRHKPLLLGGSRSSTLISLRRHQGYQAVTGPAETFPMCFRMWIHESALSWWILEGLVCKLTQKVRKRKSKGAVKHVDNIGELLMQCCHTHILPPKWEVSRSDSWTWVQCITTFRPFSFTPKGWELRIKLGRTLH